MRVVCVDDFTKGDYVCFRGITYVENGASSTSVGTVSVDVVHADDSPLRGWRAKSGVSTRHLSHACVYHCHTYDFSKTSFSFLVTLKRSCLPLSRSYGMVPFRLEVEFVIRDPSGSFVVSGRTETFRCRRRRAEGCKKRPCPLRTERAERAVDPPSAPRKVRRSEREAVTREEVMASFSAAELRQMALELEAERSVECRIEPLLCGVSGYGK